MAGGGRIPLFMIVLTMAFITCIGLMAFQTLKERKNAANILESKDSKIEQLKVQYEKDMHTARKNLLLVTQEKEKLEKQLLELGHVKDELKDSKKQLTACTLEGKKGLQEKDNEVLALKKKLKVKDDEISTTRVQLDRAKQMNDKFEAAQKENHAKHQSSENDAGDEDTEDAIDRKASEQEEKETDISDSLADDRIASESEIEDAKADVDPEDSQPNTADLEESELAATKAVDAEDDDDKELEADKKLEESDAAGETKENLAQE